MKGDIINAKWAKNARQQIEAAITEWNSSHPKKEPIRIAWGHGDAELAEDERCSPARKRRQFGLLDWSDETFEMWIWPARRDEPALCHIMTEFPEIHTLPLVPKPLYNLLSDCSEGTSLRLLPNHEKDEIVLLGLGAFISSEGLTGRVLHDLLCRLLESHIAILERLEGEDCLDHWTD
jgi:hypothetical protein